MFSQHCSRRHQYRRGVDYVAAGVGGVASHTRFCPTLEVIPGSPLHVPQRLNCSCHRWLSHASAHSMCVCVTHCRGMHRIWGTHRAVDSEECVKVCVCVLQTQRGFFNNAFSVLEQWKPVKVVAFLHISLIYLNTHLAYLQPTAPIWNLTLCLYVCVCVCVCMCVCVCVCVA